jgi:hypothetical protein
MQRRYFLGLIGVSALGIPRADPTVRESDVRFQGVERTSPMTGRTSANDPSQKSSHLL